MARYPVSWRTAAIERATDRVLAGEYFDESPYHVSGEERSRRLPVVGVVIGKSTESVSRNHTSQTASICAAMQPRCTRYGSGCGHISALIRCSYASSFVACWRFWRASYF
jgi:hypothetical protein